VKAPCRNAQTCVGLRIGCRRGCGPSWPLESCSSAPQENARKACGSAPCGGRRAAFRRQNMPAGITTIFGTHRKAHCARESRGRQRRLEPVCAPVSRGNEHARGEKSTRFAGRVLKINELLGRLLLQRRNPVPSQCSAAAARRARRDDQVARPCWRPVHRGYSCFKGRSSGEMRSMGSGNTIVELFSLEMSASVCR
jgi:hypothetical protein